MPKGDNPNSRANLLKGVEHQFKQGEKKPKEEVEQREATKARKRSFKEEFEAELAAMVKDKNGNMTTTKNAISKMAVQKAMKGDLRALELIRDTIGEKPVENITIANVDADIIAEIEKAVYDTE